MNKYWVCCQKDIFTPFNKTTKPLAHSAEDTCFQHIFWDCWFRSVFNNKTKNKLYELLKKSEWIIKLLNLPPNQKHVYSLFPAGLLMHLDVSGLALNYCNVCLFTNTVKRLGLMTGWDVNTDDTCLGWDITLALFPRHPWVDACFPLLRSVGSVVPLLTCRWSWESDT